MLWEGAHGRSHIDELQQTSSEAVQAYKMLRPTSGQQLRIGRQNAVSMTNVIIKNDSRHF